MPLIGVDRPLCFLHIAKTGGTSVTDAIARYHPSKAVLSDGGKLTVDYLQGLGDRLSGRVFLAGHSGQGVAGFLEGRADIITILRRPRDQVVSNYLHVVSDPQNPLNALASRHSLTDYLREYNYALHFQSQSLWIALSTDEDRRGLGDPDQVDGLLAFMETMPFVGVIENAEACGAVLSRMMALDQPIQLPCLNSAVYRGVSTATLARLCAEYDGLRDDPDLGYLIAVEDLVYAKARAILARLQRQLPVTTPGTRPAFIGAGRFSKSFGWAVGEEHVCSLVDPPGHLVFGPYDRLPAGRYTVEFHYNLRDVETEADASIPLEVVANGSETLSEACAPADPEAPPHLRTLSFDNAEAANVLEFRIHARGFLQGELVFHGVTIDGEAPCLDLQDDQPVGGSEPVAEPKGVPRPFWDRLRSHLSARADGDSRWDISPS